VRIYFALIGAALGFATVSGAAMAWDGSYILFKILDLQSPIPAHNRFVNIPFHWTVLLASRLTSDLTILQMVFGFIYALIPFVALALSWWIVRDQAEVLFIWAALGIGLGTLPGQFCFICEATYVIFLFWPIILAILTRMRKHQVPVILLLVMAAFFTHFVSSILFALSAIIAFAIGLRSRDNRSWMWIWAFALSAMAVLKLLTFWIFPSSYEMSMLSMDILRSFFYDVSSWISTAGDNICMASRIFDLFLRIAQYIITAKILLHYKINWVDKSYDGGRVIGHLGERSESVEVRYRF
jgi:hypothetical protein